MQRSMGPQSATALMAAFEILAQNLRNCSERQLPALPVGCGSQSLTAHSGIPSTDRYAAVRPSSYDGHVERNIRKPACL